MIKITSPENAPRVPLQVDGRIMFSNPSVEIVHLSLKPGEAIPRHINEFDVAIYILEGHGMLETTTASKEVRPGMLAEIKSGEERGIKNIGKGDFRVLVIKIYLYPTSSSKK